MDCCVTSPVMTFYPYLTGGLLVSLITFLIVVFAVRIFGIRYPALKYRLMFLPLVGPVVAYVTYPPLLTREYLLLGSPRLIIAKKVPLFADPLAEIVLYVVWAGLAWAIVKAVIHLTASVRLRRRYQAAETVVEPRLETAVADLKTRTGVRALKKLTVFCIPKRTPVAFAFGILRPTLVVSRGLVRKLDRVELEAVIAHELAHLARRDSLTILVARFLRDAMFYNPLSHLIYTFIVREKEKAADIWGIAVTREPVVFAQSIFKVWKLALRFDRLAEVRPALSYLGPRGSLLEERVEAALATSDGGCGRRVQFMSWILVGLVVSVWMSMINVGILAPAKPGPYVEFSKPVMTSDDHMASAVYVGSTPHTPDKVTFVSACANGCH